MCPAARLLELLGIAEEDDVPRGARRGEDARERHLPRPSCHELRVPDRDQTWRIIYRIDPDAIVIVHVFSKKTRQTAVSVIENCQRRLKAYDRIR